MSFEVLLAPEAAEDFSRLRAFDRARVLHALESLRHEPTKVSRRGRIKRLRGMRKPEYRLRVGDLRVFFDVIESEVHVLAIVAKSDALAWLEREGEKT